jgi:uncharacterized Ntn-hydrolase superfamily protein
MKHLYLFTIFILATSAKIFCQDTFSIVALDSTTRQVGSAGASCLDLFFAGYSNPAFLADLIPDTGVVNTQSYYIQANQDNARIRMRAGDSPAQIITWLVANDAVNNPEFKQYGIVGFNGNIPSAAAHTGSSCINYKNHITGSIDGFHYAIQGNILKGQEILDSMEARFRSNKGTLACRLMSAMQGAKVIGADTRCNTEGVSSLFAFLQVALPTDVYGAPSLNLSLRTKGGDSIEPIDSLQTLMNKANGCSALANKSFITHSLFKIYPNPANDILEIDNSFNKNIHLDLFNVLGKKIFSTTLVQQHNIVCISNLNSGLYFYTILENGSILQKGKLIIE